MCSSQGRTVRQDARRNRFVALVAPVVSELIVPSFLVFSVFQIPQTHDMLSSLFDPRLPKSNVDILTLSLLALQVALFALLPLSVSRYFFLAYFALWRLAYNAGLGYVLRRQSETKWIVRTVVQKGWMDGNKRPKVRAWIERELSKKMGEDYDFNVSLCISFWKFPD